MNERDNVGGYFCAVMVNLICWDVPRSRRTFTLRTPSTYLSTYHSSRLCIDRFILPFVLTTIRPSVRPFTHSPIHPSHIHPSTPPSIHRLNQESIRYSCLVSIHASITVSVLSSFYTAISHPFMNPIVRLSIHPPIPPSNLPHSRLIHPCIHPSITHKLGYIALTYIL